MQPNKYYTMNNLEETDLLTPRTMMSPFDGKRYNIPKLTELGEELFKKAKPSKKTPLLTTRYKGHIILWGIREIDHTVPKYISVKITKITSKPK